MEMTHIFPILDPEHSALESINEDASDVAVLDGQLGGSAGHNDHSRWKSTCTSSKDSFCRLSDRTEVTYLVDKLVVEQQKVLSLEGQVKDLNLELSKARSLHSSCLKSLTSPSRSYTRSQSADRSSLHPEEVILSGLQGAKAPRKGEMMLSLQEMRVWKTASLPQLLLMRENLITSLDCVLDAITRRHLTCSTSDNMSEGMYCDSNPAVYACLQRLFGEAFSLRSTKDTWELHSLAERMSGGNTDMFHAALKEVKQLTESDGVLYSEERLHFFIYDPSSRFATAWGEQYVNSIRNLLIAFFMNSQKIMSSKTHRMELVELVRQELSHTALLRAAQGRSIVPQGAVSLFRAREVPSKTPYKKEAPRLSSRSISSAERYTSFVKSGLFGGSKSLLSSRHPVDASSRWNPPRCRSLSIHQEDPVRFRFSRSASVASSSLSRDMHARAPMRRRTADVLGPPVVCLTPHSSTVAAGNCSCSSSTGWAAPPERRRSSERTINQVRIDGVNYRKAEGVPVMARSLRSPAL